MAQRYRPIREYAAIGDGRTVALIASDATIDWLCLPDLDSPTVFAAVLDADRGGSFELCPEVSYEARHRYVPDTNVLETIFSTATGAVRVTDAMTLPGRRLAPLRELARRVEGLSGRVPMRWRVTPRFGYGSSRTRIERRGSVPVATAPGVAVAVCAWGVGPAEETAGTIHGRFEIGAGERACFALAAAHGEPLVLPARRDVEQRLDDTEEFWRKWAGALTYDGPWRDEVVRSALALKLLVYSPSGAIAAAPTASLPETIGGVRNWDYRFSWIRDSAFTLESLLQLGAHTEAHSFFWWFMHATRLTHPRLRVLYRLDGGAHTAEGVLDLEGYRGSRPVRVGNAAGTQLQLDTYGSIVDAAFGYARQGYGLDRDTGRQLAEIADFVCAEWRQPDAGIWEVRSESRHFTQSKAMCWVALDRAITLAASAQIPASGIERWRRARDEIEHFIEERCWSEREGSYTRFAGSDEVDASLLTVAIMRYGDPRRPRMQSTIDAVRRHLGHGPLVRRYKGEDGLPGVEGAFVTCSFWLAEALAIAGRQEEAERLMEKLLPLANDVGLYAEEMDPDTHEFLGNFPQSLVHLSLISAAVACAGGRA